MPRKYERKQGINPWGQWCEKTLQEVVRRIQANNSLTPPSETEPQPSTLASDQSRGIEPSPSLVTDGTDKLKPSKHFLEISPVSKIPHPPKQEIEPRYKYSNITGTY